MDGDESAVGRWSSDLPNRRSREASAGRSKDFNNDRLMTSRFAGMSAFRFFGLRLGRRRMRDLRLALARRGPDLLVLRLRRTFLFDVGFGRFFYDRLFLFQILRRRRFFLRLL